MLSVLNILFLTLMAGQFLYLAIGLFIIQASDSQLFSNMNSIIFYTVLIMNVFIIFTSKFIYNKNVTKFDKQSALENKIKSYQINNLIFLTLLEIANIINISALIITTNYFFVVLFLIVIGLFFINRPTKEKVIMQYELNSDEAMKILD